MPEVNLSNPLGYYCAPNAATPNYAAASDVRTFIGWLCFDAAQGWDSKIEEHKDFKEFLMEVQEAAVEIVEDAFMRLKVYVDEDDLGSMTTAQDLQGNYTADVPGKRNKDNEATADYCFHLDFGEGDTEGTVLLIISAGVMNYDRCVHDDIDCVSYLDVWIRKPNWYEDAICELNVVKEELAVLHKNVKGLKSIAARRPLIPEGK